MHLKLLAVAALALNLGLGAQAPIPVGSTCHPNNATLSGLNPFVSGSVALLAAINLGPGPELSTVVVKLGVPQPPILLPSPFAPGCESLMGTGPIYSLPFQATAGVGVWFLNIPPQPFFIGVPLTAQAASIDVTFTAYVTNAVVGTILP